MGKISILSAKQKLILDVVSQDKELPTIFYLTGGTGLSEFYLQHRLSIDLDFFSQIEFDSALLVEKLNNWSKKYDFTYTGRLVKPTYIYQLKFADGQDLKVDFVHYPYRQLKKSEIVVNNLAVDSQFDIATNKLLALNQRADVKDFVDLFYLLKEYTFWDLRDGILAKFNRELEPTIAAADLLAVEDFQFLPRMLKPLKLEELKKFFREKAIELGRLAVE